MVPKQTTQRTNRRAFEGRVNQSAVGLPFSIGSVHNGGGGGFVWARVLECNKVATPEGGEFLVDFCLGEVFPGKKIRRKMGTRVEQRPGKEKGGRTERKEKKAKKEQRRFQLPELRADP